MADKIRVTVWNEGRHEKTSPEIAKVYPQGIHGAIASPCAANPALRCVPRPSTSQSMA